jgi:hypothetical protein
MMSGAEELHIGETEGAMEERDPSLPRIPFFSFGCRGSMACNILRRKWFTRLANLMGGFNGWKNAVMPILKD